jgi:hypothetical protein
MSLSFMLYSGFVRLGLEVPNIPPDLLPEYDEAEQLRQIRINLQALIISVVFVTTVALLAYLLAKRGGKKRYAAHQAQLAAEGRLERSSALSDIANSGGKPQFINDDDAVRVSNERERASMFGENYRPYGTDGTNAPGV